MKKIIISIIITTLVMVLTAKAQPFAENPKATMNAQSALDKTDRLFFIENKGQWHSDVLYLCRMGGLDAWITKYGVNYTFYKVELPDMQSDEIFPDKFDQKRLENATVLGHRVLFELQNANSNPDKQGHQKQEGYYNYFIGNDDSKHVSFIGLYKEVLIKDVYPGIDIRYYFDKGFLRYDFIVNPGADPSQIMFKLNGQYEEYLKQGTLCYTTRFGEVQMTELYTYQQGKNIFSQFVKQNNVWKIQVYEYDKTQSLIIDPLIYSTYIGGSNTDGCYSVTSDATGNAYLTGYTHSFDYDITPGVYQTTLIGSRAVFVSKLNSTGNTLIFSTYIGGGNSYGRDIAVDALNNIYITGASYSGYPTTAGAYQTTAFNEEVIVTKLNSTGTTLLFSTFIGHTGNEYGTSIQVDPINNDVYITGATNSINFPRTVGAYQLTYGGGTTDGFLTKISNTGTTLIFSSFIGGNDMDVPYSLSVRNGFAFIAGVTTSTNYPVTAGAYQTTASPTWMPFVTRFNLSGTSLMYSTFLSTAPLGGEAYGISVDATYNAYVTGSGPGVATTAGAYSTAGTGFLAKLNPTGSALVYSTRLEIPLGVSSGWDVIHDALGRAYVVGQVNSNSLATTPGAFQTSHAGSNDAFLVVMNSSGSSALYSSYFGGTGLEAGYTSIALDNNNNPIISGTTNSTNLPVTTGAYQTSYGGGTYDGFAAKFCLLEIALTSISGSDNQTVCVNNTINNITYNTFGAVSTTVTGLPAGVISSFNADTITISGTPTVIGTFNYVVTIMNVCDTISTTGTITVNANNTITLTSAAGTNNQTVCVNTPITNITYSTTGATGATVTGLPTGITGNFSAGTVTISGTPTATGTFNYTVTTTGGCGTATATGTITVNPDNTIALTSAAGTNNQTVCVNTPITNITYSTTGATGATVTGLPTGVTGNFSAGTVTISGTPTATGTFNYTVTTTGGCGTATATGTITVNPDNTIALTSAAGTNNQTVCVNTPITSITYSTTGATGATVTGLPTGVTGNFSAGTVTISGTPTATGTFNYTVTTTGGCGTATATGTITVNPDNTIALTSAAGTNNQTVCVNTPITSITYSTTGATGATVTGLPTGVTGNFSAGTVTISGTPTATGTFNYTVTTTGGCGTATATGTITVISNNTITLTSAAGTDNQTVCVNTAITNITYSTTGATGATVTGLPTGVTGNFNAGTVTISGTPTATGTFNYTVTTTGGCGTATATGTITVNPNNTITLTSAAGTDNQTVCVNTPITNITYSTTGATGATVSGLPSGVTGNYSGGVVTISGTPTTTGTFNYTVTTTGGCGTATATGTITVNPDNTITLTSPAGTDNQTVCINTPITNITYNTTGATGATVIGLPTGITGNFSSGTVTISGTPTATGTFNYTVTTTGGCGTATATGTITVNPDNTIALTSAAGTDNQTVCVNTSITNITYSTTGATGATVTGLPTGVTGNFSGGTVTISGTPTATGTFTYTVSLTGGCGTVTATGTITVNPLPSVSAGSNSPVCEGDNINLTGLPSGMTSYDWTGPNSFNSTQQNPVISNATSAATGTYNLTVTDNNGCSATTSINVTVVPQFSVTASSNAPICAGGNLQLTTSNVTGASYSWTGPGSYSSTIQNPVISNAGISQSGTYTVTATIGSCSQTASVSVTVHLNPEVTLVAENSTCGEPNGSIQSTVSSGTTPYSYQWSSGATSPAIENLSPGNYVVTLSDANNCTVTANSEIINEDINCDYFVYVANAFTPNGDGVNDLIPVHGKGVVSLKFVIYNRWGNKVFETEQLNQGWDGTYKGEPQNSAVFVYVLEATFINGQTHKESGEINLIR